MYRVEFRKTIFFTELGDYENRAGLRVELTLPFAPYPGLRVIFGNGLVGEAIVESVTWINDDSYFSCETLPEIEKSGKLLLWIDSGWAVQSTKVQVVLQRT